MILVKVRENSIMLFGHAGYAEVGKDIVCAGVTVLLQTLIESIETLTNDKIEYDISPGKADIKYGKPSKKASSMIDSFFIGICLIAEEFPKCIRIV